MTEEEQQPSAPAPPAPAADLSPAECGARLAALFPALFAPADPPSPVKPIKLKIHADIQARAPGVFSKRILGVFFSRYTTSNAYLKALVNAPHRFDLDGQPAGEIADEHRKAAAEELQRRHEVHAARRSAQREAQIEAERDARKAEQAKAREAQQQRWAEDAARRERAQLLRAFETSSLTKANFCVLKRIDEATLDAQLEQARAERTQWQQQAPQHAQRPPPRKPPPGKRPPSR